MAYAPRDPRRRMAGSAPKQDELAILREKTVQPFHGDKGRTRAAPDFRSSVVRYPTSLYERAFPKSLA